MALGLLQDGELAQGIYTGNRGPAGERGAEEGRRRGEGTKQNVSYLQFVRNPNGNYRLTEYSCEQLRNLTSTGLEENSGANWLMRSMRWKN